MTEPIVVSYSELDAYRQCPLKHLWAYKERWKKPPAPGSPLSRGSLWHDVLEVHYLRLMELWEDKRINVNTNPHDKELIQEVVAEARAQLFDPDSGEYVSEDAELIDWMYEGHVEWYGLEPEWTPVAVEYPFQIPLLDEDGEPSDYHIKGKIDVILRHNATGLLWVVDHKSAANLAGQQDLEIDDQFGLYVWAMRQLGHRIVGSIHSAARTKRNTADYPGYKGKLKPQTLESRFKRTLLNRSEEETDAVAHDAYATAVNAYPAPGRELPLYSAPNPRQCGWKCDFKEIHLMTRQGVDAWGALRDSGFVQDFTRHN